MADAAPGEVGDVEQAVDAVEIHEHAEVGDVLDLALAALADDERVQELAALLGQLGLQELAARKDDVVALGHELDELELVLVADEAVRLVHRHDVDLRAGEEGLHAVDVHDEAAAHLALHEALHDGPLLVALEHGLPLDLLVGELLGEDDHAVVVLALDDEHVHLVAGLDRRDVAELGRGDRALGLASDVHEDLGGTDLEDHALVDAVLERLAGVLVEEGLEFLALFRVLLGFLEHCMVPASAPDAREPERKGREG